MVQFSKDGSIIRSNSEINRSERLHSPEHLVTRTYQAAKPVPIRDGIMARLFPNAEEKAIAQARLELIKTDAEFMKEALVVSRRTQIASLEEACQNYLVRQKIDARQEIDSYILEARKQLQEGSIPLFKIPKEKIISIAAVPYVWLDRNLLSNKIIKSGMLPFKNSLTELAMNSFARW